MLASVASPLDTARVTRLQELDSAWLGRRKNRSSAAADATDLLKLLALGLLVTLVLAAIGSRHWSGMAAVMTAGSAFGGLILLRGRLVREEQLDDA